MTVNPLSSISQMWLSGINNNSTSRTAGTASTTTTSKDNSQLSPFAQLMSALQQMEHTNPTQYKQVAATLSSDLKNAAAKAQNDGDGDEANALNQLAASFNQSSQSGQLPSFMQQGTQPGNTAGHHHHPQGGGLRQDLNSISQTVLSGLNTSGSGTTTAQ